MISPRVRRIIRRHIRPFGVRENALSELEYWRQRAREFGERWVLNLGHPVEEYQGVTQFHKREIFPHFTRALKGDERVLLDLGCGQGRFTPDLAALVHGWAIGMDIVNDYLEMAYQDPRVEYRLLREGDIGLPDVIVDAVWVCLVLGGIKGPTLIRTAAEIDRRLKAGGLLFLVENTSVMQDS
jgi:SAM-dependent methyltransferase